MNEFNTWVASLTSLIPFVFTLSVLGLIGNLLLRYAIWRHQMNEYWKMLEMVANSIEHLREEIKNKAR